MLILTWFGDHCVSQTSSLDQIRFDTLFDRNHLRQFADPARDTSVLKMTGTFLNKQNPGQRFPDGLINYQSNHIKTGTKRGSSECETGIQQLSKQLKGWAMAGESSNRRADVDTATTQDSSANTSSMQELSRFLWEYLKPSPNSPAASQDNSSPTNGDGLYDSTGNQIDISQGGETGAAADQPVVQVRTADNGTTTISFFPNLESFTNGDNGAAQAVLSTDDQGVRRLDIFDRTAENGSAAPRFSSSVAVDPETQRLTFTNQAQVDNNTNAEQQIVMNPDGTGTFSLVREQADGGRASFLGTFNGDSIDSMRIVLGNDVDSALVLDPEKYPDLTQQLREFLTRVESSGTGDILLLPPAVPEQVALPGQVESQTVVHEQVALPGQIEEFQPVPEQTALRNIEAVVPSGQPGRVVPVQVEQVLSVVPPGQPFQPGVVGPDGRLIQSPHDGMGHLIDTISGEAERTAQEIIQTQNLGEATRNAYIQAENSAKLPAFLEAVNLELTRQNSPFRLQDNTQNFQGDRRSLALVNSRGEAIRTQSFDRNVGANGAPPQVLTGPQELRETLNSELPRFNNQGGDADQRRLGREQAITGLSTILQRQQNHDASQMLDRMRVVHTVSNIGDATTSGAASESLADLRRHAQEGNGDARRMLDWLTQRAGGSEALQALENRISQGGDQAQDALTELRNSVNSEASPLLGMQQQLRVDEIVQAIPENPTVESLRAAETRLNAELQLPGQGTNTGTRDMHASISTERMVASLSRPELASEAMAELQHAARSGNVHARQALAAILVSGNERGAGLFRDQSSNVETANRRTPIPDLSVLSPEAAGAIRLAAANTLIEVATRDGNSSLSRSEATALTVAFAGAAHRRSEQAGTPSDEQLTTSITRAFQNILSHGDARFATANAEQRSQFVRETQTVMRALTDVLISDMPGAGGAAGLYILAANSEFNRYLPGSGNFDTGHGEDFRLQERQITEAARAGNRGALTVLSAIAGGVGSQNSFANEEIRNQRGQYVPGDALARRAQTSLLNISRDNPTMRDNIMNAMTDRAQGLAPDSRYRLETLGQVAALNPGSVPDNVRQALREGLQASAPEARTSAMSGLLALRGALNNDDMEAIARSVSPETAIVLANNRQHLTPAQGRQLMDLFAQQLSTGDAAHRTSAVTAMGALAPFATSAHITAIRAFGGAGQHSELQLSMSGPAHLGLTGSLERGVENATRFQRAAGETLLSISQHSNDVNVRRGAFNSFAGTTWSMDLNAPQVRARLREVQRAHPDDLTINLGVARLGYDLGNPSLAATFRERGVTFSDEVTNRLVGDANRNYGETTVRQIVDRVSLFNSLPPEVRRQISSSTEPLAPGQSFNLNGRILDTTLFNSLSPAVREQISGSPEPLPAPRGHSLNGVSMTGATFNRLPPELRLQLNGSTDLVAPDLSMQSSRFAGQSIDALTFNSLPMDLRAMFGGDTANIPYRNGWPDLGRASLSAEAFNSLSPAQRRALSGSEAWLPAGQNLTFQGRTLDTTTFNSLPASLREALTGSSAVLPDGRVLRDLSTVSIGADAFNALPETVRSNLTGRTDNVNINQVLAQLGNRTLGDADSANRFLLGPPPLEQAVSGRFNQANTARDTAERDLRAMYQLRDSLMGDFRESSNRSANLERALSLLPMAAGLIPALSLIPGGDNQALQNFERDQIRRVVGLHQVNQRIQELEAVFRQRSAQADLISIGRESMSHAQLLREGNTLQADLLALRMFSQYGGQLSNLAPDVVRSLLTGGEQSGWMRLHRAGHVQSATIPSLTGDTPQARVLSGLDLLRQTTAFNPDVQRPFGDAELRRRIGLSAIDEHPDARALMGAFRTVSENMQVLLIQGQATGTRYENFTADGRARADLIQGALNSITRQQLENAINLRNSLRETLNGQTITDPEARRQLQERVNSLDQALRIFNPQEPNNVAPGRAQAIQTRLGELNPLLARVVSEGGSPGPGRSAIIRERGMQAHPGETEAHMWQRYVTQWRQEAHQLRGEQAFNNGPNGHQRLQELLTRVRSPDFAPDTFGRWIRGDGAVMAAGLIAAVAIAEVVSFGMATPLVVAALGTGAAASIVPVAAGIAAGTAGFIIGSEAARETQFQLGSRSVGSSWGEWNRGTVAQDEYGNRRPREFVRDVAAPHALDFIIGSVTGLVTAGLGYQIGSGIRSAWNNMSSSARNSFVAENGAALNQLSSRLTRLEQQVAANPAQRGLATSMMRNLGMEAIFSGAEAGADALASAISDGNPVVGFVVGVLSSASESGLSVNTSATRPARAGARPAANEPHMTMEFRGTAIQEQQFFRSLELRGSTVTRTDQGYRVTAEGLRIDYVRVGSAEGTPSTRPNETPVTRPTDTPATRPTDTPTTRPTDTPATRTTDTPATRPTETPVRPGDNQADSVQNSVQNLLRTVNNASNGWPDLTAHSDRVSDYFATQARYQSALNREVTVLVAQGRLPNDGTALAVLQQRVAEGQGSPLLTMMHDSLARMRSRTPEIARVESNLRMLQERLPGFRLNVADLPTSVDGMYMHGQNNITINAIDLLSPEGGRRVGETLAHETVHRNQDVLIIRSIAQELRTGTTPVDPSTPQGLSTLQQRFRERTGFALDNTFASQVLAQHGNEALTPTQMNQGTRLAESIRTLTRDSLIAGDRAGTLLLDANNLINRPESLDSFLQGLTDAASRRRYFGTDEIPWLEPLLAGRRAGHVTDQEVAGVIAERLGQHANEISMRSYESYRNALHEVEAWHATEIAESARPGQSEQPMRPSGRSDRPVDPRRGSSMNSSHEESLALLRQQLARTPGGAPPPEVVRAFESLTPQQLDLTLTMSAPSLNALTSAMRAGTIPPEALSQITSSATLLRRVDQLLRPQQGTTARPAEALRDIFRLPPAALEHATVLAARSNVSNELLQLVTSTIPADRLYLYERFTPAVMHDLLSIPNATTRGLYEQALFTNALTPNGMTEVRSIAGRSPEMGQLVGSILSRPMSREMPYQATISQLAEARLDAPTLTALGSQIRAGTVPLASLGPLSLRGQQGIALMVRTIDRAGLNAGATQRLLSLAPGQADLVGRLLSDGIITPEMTTRTLGLSDTHREAVLEILSQERSRSASSRVSRERLGELIGDQAQAIREVQDRAARAAENAPRVVAPHDRLQTSLDQLRSGGLSPENQTALSQLISRSRAEGGDYASEQAQALDALARRASAGGTPLSPEHINFFVRRVLEDPPHAPGQQRLTTLNNLTDMLVHHPNAAENFRAYSQLDAYNESVDRQGFNRLAAQTGSPSLLNLPGWRAVSENGALVTTGGQLHLEHSGRMTIPVADARHFDMNGTFREVSQNSDGTLTIELRQPMQIRATAEDILLASIGARSGGVENCANAVRAYLANITHPDGLNNLIRDGRLIPPDPQPSFQVRRVNYDGLDVVTADTRRSSAFPSEQTPIVDPAQLQPGLYVARTRSSAVAGDRDVSHTFLVSVPREGSAFVFDAANGQRLPLSSMGNNLIIHTVRRGSTGAQIMGSN